MNIEPIKIAERFLLGALALSFIAIVVVVTVLYFDLGAEPRVVAIGEGPEAIATPPEGTAGSIPDWIEAATPCVFTDREELKQAMIACTRRGSKSVSRQVGGRECFTFECGDGKR